jgi:hypothetical protein
MVRAFEEARKEKRSCPGCGKLLSMRWLLYYHVCPRAPTAEQVRMHADAYADRAREYVAARAADRALLDQARTPPKPTDLWTQLRTELTRSAR